MKRTTLVLFSLLVCLFVQAQDYTNFNCSTEKESRTITDSLLKESKRQYKLVDSLKYQNNYILDYEYKTETAPLKIRFAFSVYKVGANPDLEIEGKIVYTLKSIYGKYLDIFPIWKKYINPEADMETLSKKFGGDKKQIPIGDKTKVYTFRSDDNGYWILSIHEINNAYF